MGVKKEREKERTVAKHKGLPTYRVRRGGRAALISDGLGTDGWIRASLMSYTAANGKIDSLAPITEE